jgi:hypothetical protein
LESAATLTWEIKPYDKVSSLRGANTLLQGQQNKNRDKRVDHRRQINRQIKAADSRRDQHRSEKTRPKEIKGPGAEEPGPFRDTTSEGQSTL